MQGKSQDVLARLAWPMAALCIFGALAGVVMWFRQQSGPISLFDWTQALGWGLTVPVVLSVLGALIISRQPANRVGWLLLLPGLSGAPVSLLLGEMPVAPATMTLRLWLLAWIGSWSWILVIFPVLLLPLHFPTGRPPTPRWRWVNWLALGMVLFFLTLTLFSQTFESSDGAWSVHNPIGFLSQDVFDERFMVGWSAGLIVLTAGSVTSLLVRYRRSGFVERQQIKWLLYAGAMFAVVYSLSVVINFEETSEQNVLLDLAFIPSILALPVAITVAILRYRALDVDIIIRRTLVYSILSGTLLLTYFGTVALLEGALRGVTGEGGALAVVLSTLIIAALFNPIRNRIQGFIDKRLYRSRYDAQVTLEGFGGKLRERETADLERLTVVLREVILETVHPAHIAIWLTPQSRLHEPVERSRHR